MACGGHWRVVVVGANPISASEAPAACAGGAIALGAATSATIGTIGATTTATTTATTGQIADDATTASRHLTQTGQERQDEPDQVCHCPTRPPPPLAASHIGGSAYEYRRHQPGDPFDSREQRARGRGRWAGSDARAHWLGHDRQGWQTFRHIQGASQSDRIAPRQFFPFDMQVLTTRGLVPSFTGAPVDGVAPSTRRAMGAPISHRPCAEQEQS